MFLKTKAALTLFVQFVDSGYEKVIIIVIQAVGARIEPLN
jgi:hypothetical protein